MHRDALSQRILFDALTDSGHAIALFDERDYLRWANRCYQDRFLRNGPTGDVSFADVLRHGFAHGIGVKVDSGDIEAFVASVLSRRRSRPVREFATDLVDGTWLWVKEQAIDNGWLLCTLTDITGLKRAEHSLARAHAEALEASRTDALTGASSRAWVMQLAEQALEGCMQSAQPFSVVLMDLDDFKAINDRFGHAAGDAVLKHVVAHFRSHLRPQDVIGRMGGEEFLIIFPHTMGSVARSVVDRLRGSLSAADGIAYSFSAGVAEASLGEDLSELLKRADDALYGAKRAGRNRTMDA